MTKIKIIIFKIDYDWAIFEQQDYYQIHNFLKTSDMYMSSKPTYGNFNLANFPEFRAADLLLLTKIVIL
jgi:hypothetical protein